MAKSENFLPENHRASSWDILPTELQHPTVLRLIELSLVEDLTSEVDLGTLEQGITQGDVTSTASLEEADLLKGQITAKSPGAVAGFPVAEAVFKRVDAGGYLS